MLFPPIVAIDLVLFYQSSFAWQDFLFNFFSPSSGPVFATPFYWFSLIWRDKHKRPTIRVIGCLALPERVSRSQACFLKSFYEGKTDLRRQNLEDPIRYANK